MGYNGTAGTAHSQEANTLTPMDWAKDVRRLDGVLLDHMGIRNHEHPQLGAALELPYKRNGETYAAKYRRPEPKDWRSTQGVSRGLYNEDCLDEAGPVIITEGEFDALACIQAGFEKSVSLPDGWSEDGEKRDCLIKEEKRLRQADFVIVAGDNDAAGRTLPKAVSNILIGHDVRYVSWPKGCKDANDCLAKHGEVGLARCLKDARQIDPEGGVITGVTDLPPMPKRRVLKMNMPAFESLIAYEQGAMSVVTGIPGFGKSTFTTFSVYHVARTEGVKVGFLAFETNAKTLRDNLCRLHIHKRWDELSEEQRQEVGAYLDERFRIVHRKFDTDTKHHLGWLRSMIYTLAIRDNCKLIVVDPWNELEHLPEQGESLTNYINFALQQIRQWAAEFDCHICVVAHPKKMGSDRGTHPPMGYDVADSAAFFNKPALGYTVHQEKTEDGTPVVKIQTWKVREVELYGVRRGSGLFIFEPVKMAYVPLDMRGDI